MDNGPTVLVATPSYDAKVNVNYANSLRWMTEYSTVKFDHVMLCNDALIQRVRNDAMAMFLASEHDYLLFIDSDQGWMASDVEQTMELMEKNPNVGVIGHPIRKRSDEVAFNVVWSDAVEYTKNDLRPFYPVAGVGTGFMMISREAATKVCETVPHYVENGQEKPLAFNVDVVDGKLTSEDIMFCQAVQYVGKVVAVKTASNVVHYDGTKPYYTSFTEALDEIFVVAN